VRGSPPCTVPGAFLPLLPAPDLAAARVLRTRLGLLAAAAVGLRIKLDAARGRPFGDLPAASDPRERASRRQAGDAVLLYRALLRRLDRDAAFALAGDVLHEAALAFLDETVGPLGPGDLRPLSADARLAFVRERLVRFPNVEADLVAAEPDRVAFRVTRCRLVELVREAGHPELAPLFCTADATFFGQSRPGVTLERPGTLAGGASDCHFILHASGGEP